MSLDLLGPELRKNRGYFLVAFGEDKAVILYTISNNPAT
jgi:hypothetical protein